MCGNHVRVANREGSPPWGGRKRAGDGFRKSKEGGEGKRRRRTRKKKKERENINGRARKKKGMRGMQGGKVARGVEGTQRMRER